MKNYHQTRKTIVLKVQKTSNTQTVQTLQHIAMHTAETNQPLIQQYHV